MLMYKICLTGGPSAGKTSVLKEIKEELEVLGFRVFTIDETATRLINMGIKPFGDNKIDYIEFEEKLINLQIYEEDCYDHALNNIWNEPCILLCDRGLIDPLAYIDEKIFENIINKKNLTKGDILKRYDLVLHLETAAKKNGYTKENNKARSENATEACILDDKTINAWKGHDNLKVIKSYDDFNEKIIAIKKVILSEVIKNINNKNKVKVNERKTKNAV